MPKYKKLLLFFCSSTFMQLLQDRSTQLEMSMPDYIKYIVAKDVAVTNFKIEN